MLQAKTVSSVLYRTAGTMASVTAGIIVIGDEILKGYTRDTNSAYLTRKLFSWGIKVERISIIPDKVDVIAAEVAKFSASYTHVFTSGGVGPTHDDITYEGIAKAFGESVMVNEEIRTLAEKYFGPQTLDSPVLKLAKVPQSAEIVFGTHPKTGEKADFPVVKIHNVWAFPGIPALLEKSFRRLEGRFRSGLSQFFATAIYVRSSEFEIADIMTAVAQKYADIVNIGSYPQLVPRYYAVKITVDSTDAERGRQAEKDLRELLPEGSIVDFDPDPTVEAGVKLENFLSTLSTSNPQLGTRITTSLDIVSTALERYAADEICIAFNGGKDCCTLLHLTWIALQKKYGLEVPRMKAVYFKPDDSFSETDSFVDDSGDRYHLTVVRLSGNIRVGLQELKEQHPQVKAILMGTRDSDPNSRWPEFMRISPILLWRYKDIWTFLRGLWVPYCSLYDKGFTSIGGKNNTVPTPSLQFIDRFGRQQFHPAYLLEDESLERSGRVTKTTANNSHL